MVQLAIETYQNYESLSVMKSHFQMFAHYNQWANMVLYDAAEQLSDSDYRADRGAFFKSLHGTLSHLLAADRIWMKRFTGAGDAPDRLDTILFADLKALRAARAAEDRRVIEYIDGLSDEALSGSVSYRRLTSPEPIEQKLASALAHFFNHQTHHRGQAHALITALSDRTPEIDLIIYQRLAARD